MIKTHIKGLDEILKGGIRENSSIVVQGSPGTGKTILALEFIYRGALKGEPGLFITSEVTKDDLINYALTLGMKIAPLIDKGLFNIVEQPILRANIVSLEVPLKIIKDKKVKRVALDSLILFHYEYSQDKISLRKAMLRLISSMKNSGVTLLATSERTEEGIDNLDFNSEDFLFDGIILMLRIRKGASYERCLTIMKMRGQNHLTDIYPITLGSGGIRVHSEEMPFSLIESGIKNNNNDR